MKSINSFYALPASFRTIIIVIVSFTLFNGLLSSCSAQKSVVIPNIETTALKGYMVKDTSLLTLHDFNVWLVTTATSFDSLFTTAITSSFKPNFDEQIALAIRAQTMTTSYKVNFKQMIRRGTTLNVYFKVKKEKPDAEDAGWVSLTAFPKNQSIRIVNFYHDDVMIRSIPVVIVY